MRFELEIEENKCWGCKTCEVACKQENDSPEGQGLIHVSEEGPLREADGRWRFIFRVNRCRHCDSPPCIEACPVGAIKKRVDGIVVLNEDDCAGCGGCVDACPYKAVAFNEARGVASKCNMCHHRVDKGLLPACADNVCLAHCIQFTSGETTFEDKR